MRKSVNILYAQFYCKECWSDLLRRDLICYIGRESVSASASGSASASASGSACTDICMDR